MVSTVKTLAMALREITLAVLETKTGLLWMLLAELETQAATDL